MTTRTPLNFSLQKDRQTDSAEAMNLDCWGTEVSPVKRGHYMNNLSEKLAPFFLLNNFTAIHVQGSASVQVNFIKMSRYLCFAEFR